jgi:hypothetical protein
MFLKGTIFITDNLDRIYSTPLNQSTKIISLDEDGILMENKDILGGTCLLPPIEAKVAEADGNEQLYDSIYSNHLLAPYQQNFISAIIAFLYKGGNLILFLPEIGYTNTTEKLVEHLYRIYGIHVGIISNPNPVVANCYYDAKCIPIWLNMIFMAGVISPYEYLYQYPLDAQITNQEVLNLLIIEMKPYGETLYQKIDVIKRIHYYIHQNPNVRPAVYMEE